MALHERMVKLIAVGRMRDRFCEQQCAEFLTRCRPYGRVECVTVPDADVAAEGRSILRELDKERSSIVVALSEEGREFSTEEFSAFLGKADRKLVFVIGGPFGLAPEVKSRAQLVWSLSRLTFSHQMVRLVFVEQLYRACTIIKGEPYHHE